jgi:alpha-amylase/alpha-mannosidase (GH57 family)
MKYIMIFHANLNYAYLPEERYEFVIRKSYEMTFDTMREKFPDSKYVFEASGFTIEQMALKTPDVLEKLKSAISTGQCEFMGSPYAHPMLPNFPMEDGLYTLEFSNEIYQKYLGMQPVSFWNPECGWREYVPKQVSNAGYKNLIGDFEAYSRSVKPDGQPQRPEIYEKEFSKETSFYNFSFKYDLSGSEPAIHFPFNNAHGLEKNQLNVFLRTDRIAQFAVRFFMGMEGYTFEKYMDLIKKYSAQNEGEKEGAVIIFADDAEYLGTNGWFKLKYQNMPDNVFEHTPESRDKLIRVVEACNKMGPFTTIEEQCKTAPAIEDEISFDDDSAWHGAKASTWASTPMARLLRPWQDLVRNKIKEGKMDPAIERKAWYYLTNSYNSDGQWPPTLPDAPHIIHPYNYKYCFDNLLKAELIVGGVNRNQLKTSPIETLTEILSIQANLIKDKAKSIISGATSGSPEDAQIANRLIEICLDFTSIEKSGLRILHPSEYEVRAYALIEARRLVGGVELEKASHVGYLDEDEK